MLVRLNVYLFVESCARGRLHFDFSALTIPLGFGLPNGVGRKFGKSVANFVETTLLAARPGIEHKNLHRLVGPYPIANFGQILSSLVDVLLMFHQPVAQELFEVGINGSEPLYPIHYVAGKMKAVELV